MWNLGVGGLGPPENRGALGPCRASAVPGMLGETKPPCPGRAFSPQGDPGAEAPREVSPLEPRPHQSAGCSALGPAGPLRNCRLWATVRNKWVTDPPATAPTPGSPSPHPLGSQPLGPSPGLPTTAVHRPQVLPRGRGRGGAGGRSCLSGRLSWRRCPFRALHWLPAPQLQAGWGLTSLPPPCTPHLWPSWLPLCLSGPRASGAAGGWGGVRGHPSQGSLTGKPTLLALRTYCSISEAAPPWLGPLSRRQANPLGQRQVSPGAALPIRPPAVPPLPDRPSCAPGLGRRAVPHSEVWGAGLLGRLAGPRQ